MLLWNRPAHNLQLSSPETEWSHRLDVTSADGGKSALPPPVFKKTSAIASYQWCLYLPQPRTTFPDGSLLSPYEFSILDLFLVPAIVWVIRTIPVPRLRCRL